ncbi:U11/U12 small nuclear ribonucleoprotein 48 kDa protein-like [Corythoichthys intestinalis]|uniref:U11/U12 small nuclear ribonucleoprotein 48 kDa protein-like n=1 Tax=Corythoichthys intestinalis TaxID=161448 RepID=UPI0025A5E9AD|nr:U11/U12 small nuclear ribonucleoprotein 48 kDa protein-like [Corythoichthys intestinalis]XP_057689424.1 U11/U12 small nuclear ribonucleoprotein 48 kDa protein-like [Corythoichthys intestinalis]XP_061812037.1 U11/U12 small nuclear ribonucleoprotein 48 kDa protein-like [Nerophis lumbriciformis]
MSDSTENITLQQRTQLLVELIDFTKKCNEQIQGMYDALGWTPDTDRAKEPMEVCPYDPGHLIPVRSMERHKASCCLRKMGYSSEEQAAMCDSSGCYDNTSVRSFMMDKNLQNQVIIQAKSAAPLMKMEGVFWKGQYSQHPVDVPQNHKRAVCDLTAADRLALYDHVIGVLNREKADGASGNDELYVDLVSKLKKAEQQNEPKTHLELMAEMRDYKRRRQSYRAKNVHITKKSYTEIIREVIQVHSEELSRQWKEQHQEDEDEKEKEEAREGTSQRRHPDERRSASSESRRSRRRRSREKSRDRERKKKKRKRDSRSPEDKHRNGKKKKKKKEERERSDSS